MEEAGSENEGREKKKYSSLSLIFFFFVLLFFFFQRYNEVNVAAGILSQIDSTPSESVVVTELVLVTQVPYP